MLRKALAVFGAAATLLSVGVFDPAPADARVYARGAYRGGAVGVYRGARGRVAVRAGYYGGGYRTGYYRGRGYYGGGYRTGYYGGGYRSAYYGGRGYYGGGYRTAYYGGRGYYGGGYRPYYSGGYYGGYGNSYADDYYADDGYPAAGYGGGYGCGCGGGYDYPPVRLGGAWMQNGFGY